MLTFAFGSGLAGLAGAFLSQIGNVGPSLGQTYIVDSFMTVVVGGVGSIVGTVWSAVGIGTADQVLQQTNRFARHGQDRRARRHHPVLAMETGRLVRHSQPESGLIMCAASRANLRHWSVVIAAAAVDRSCCPCLNALCRAGHFLHVSDFSINLYGKYLCYAILAISVDLLWGYTGL